jgi:hypothetical protein
MKEQLTTKCPKTGKECSVRAFLVARRLVAVDYIAEEYQPSLESGSPVTEHLNRESFARDRLDRLLGDRNINCTKDRCVVLARVVDLAIIPPVTAPIG